ncbi:hypothetical protein [Metamycoplasma arthritidis]|uniref:Hypothetical membrane protein n=1 Tax=Metamycoplasma arthritidis (strain 158L3-1) TaxID=243272 RepID=B3PMW4_META1|nr:hypothetical protein [Metamycoplasma arthritidis]ACF07366.1 hypothetical membrane protein [Metamycoplasma arthritidis 158L3-1]
MSSMKSLYKNHTVYFFKNKTLISLVAILFFSSFAASPFFFIQPLLYNFNWIAYFIVYAIVILLALILNHFFLISTKKNQYDQILNSLHSNSRKIFISKYLFLLSVFGVLSFLIAIILASFMFTVFTNNFYNLLYFLGIFISNFVVFNAFFWIFSLFSSFSKNLLYKNIVNVSLGILVTIPAILVRSLLAKDASDESLSQITKITEVSKENKINNYYVSKNAYESQMIVLNFALI